MTSIASFIRNELFLPRLNKAGVLVVYDPERRYHALCQELGDERTVLVDAGMGSIESRARAMAALQQLGQELPRPIDGLLVYVPASAPRNDEERQRDPFSLYAECGAIFPDGDGDGYESLCLKYKADHPTEIRRIFRENPAPSFEVIDAVGGGAGWPQLQALLHVASAREILLALLAPTKPQKDALAANEAWVSEARALFASALGFKLKTSAKHWGPIADELARFVLFSEFAFDLPVGLPAQLADVPRANADAQILVEDLCQELRGHERTQADYIQRAEAIERELKLVAACEDIQDLGTRDTFPFEERSFFAKGMDHLLRDNVDELRKLFDRHDGSIWARRGENQAQWKVLLDAANLVETCADATRQLPDHTRSQAALIDFYLTGLYKIDHQQRELEQQAGDGAVADGFDGEAVLKSVIKLAREHHRTLANTVQNVFLRHLEREGWPPPSRLANADVFDKLVAPPLRESGRRVAVLLIDALRYELGVELQRTLVNAGQMTLQAAFAQLPTYTLVGMASLLPGAGRDLRLVQAKDKLVPYLGDQKLETVTERLEVLKSRYGSRFADMTLRGLLNNTSGPTGEIDLLVIRSNEMDAAFEGNADSAPKQIADTLRQIQRAIRKLADLGFNEAVIVTDHGFHLNTAVGPGDKCAKPSGAWVNVHDRMLLGDGSGDTANLLMQSAMLGIRGDFAQVAMPRAMVAYQAGASYFHGGASLQEAVVPVITIALPKRHEKIDDAAPTMTLTYKKGGKTITSRRPSFELSVGEGDLFSANAAIAVLVQAQDGQGNPVGEAIPSKNVDATTRIISIEPGEKVNLILAMLDDFAGKFTVKALDPNTNTIFSKIELKTDYTE